MENPTAQNPALAEDKTLETWSVSNSQTIWPAIIAFSLIAVLFVASFIYFFIFLKSTEIWQLVIPIVLFLLTLVVLPELIKSLKAVDESADVSITERGVYKRLGPSEGDIKFVAWDLMVGYDMRYLNSSGLIGKLFPRPTKFHIKSKYEDDSFWVDAFGEHIDVLQAYLKEHNVAFGYLV